MIDIVDYGMGNLRSVQKAIEKIGYEAHITSDKNQLTESNLMILPGVGAFDRAVENLKNEDLWTVIEEHLADSKPFLGICLGLQLLFDGSHEGDRSGFGYFSGQCKKFSDVEPVPHMGWNKVKWNNSSVKTYHDPKGTKPQCYYFVHSYYPDPEDDSIVAGETDYGDSFCCAAAEDNILGVQFHPEKSQFAGLNLLTNYLDEYGPQPGNNT